MNMSGEGGNDAVLQARLDALRSAFLKKVPQLVADLREAVEQLETADDARFNDKLSNVRQQAHRTAGTAATYGLAELATAHRRVEHATGAKGQPMDLAEIKAGMAEIEAIAARVVPTGSGSSS
jgi:HPt (histidine-containing phosphotransfer) domain-containing protein